MSGKTMCGRRQRGASLVELLVGSCVSLFVLGGANALLLHQSQTHRHTHLQLRLQDEARTTARILEREVLRAGAGFDAEQAWQAGRAAELDTDAARLQLRHRSEGQVQTRTLRWREGQLELRIDDGGFQPLTDRSLLQVSAFHLQIEQRDQALEGRSGACGQPAVLQERWLHLRFTLQLRAGGARPETRALQLPLPPVLNPPECP